MYRVPELLGEWRVRIEGSEVRVIGLVAIGAPISLEGAGVRIEHRHAPVAVTIGQVRLIGFGIDEDLCHAAEVLRVVAALALPGLSVLRDELAVLRELQDV